MRGNNKGFTLVELLAALVILSILAILAMPSVVNLLGNSRDKLYITDAKKLISQAEYKIRAASSEIEKPDNGECLLLSMVYLDNSDFDKAPNDGEYIREASYVVVKNNNGNYEYSVELVEELKKGGFKGVELSKNSSLSTSSTKHVVSFSKSQLYFVESNDAMGKYNGSQVDTQYINSKLGSSYVSGISKVYNYPDLADSAYNANFAIPKIVRAEYSSASNKNFNSLDSILKIVVSDTDTPTDKLSVIVGPASAGKYPDVNASMCDVNNPYNFTECKYSYGMLKDFSLKVDFSQAGYNYSGQTASLYVVVVDPEGNTDKISPTYKIHTNEAPIIDENKSGLFRRSSDSINLSTAVLRLYVSDDSTPNGDLEYCVTEDKNATTCSNGYRKYSDFVNSELAYTFNCDSSQCNYDGQTLDLKVFLRDNDSNKPLEITKIFSYKLFKNDVPQIHNVELTSERLPFVTNESLALKTNVKFTVEDSSNENNIRIMLDESPNFNKNPVSYSYADFNGSIDYTFSGYYDGLVRTLYIKATDEYGASSTHKEEYGKVHKNQKPVVKKIDIVSENILENVCPSSKICDKYNGGGGAYEAVVNVTASDDLVSDDKLYICISTNENDCSNENISNFLPYSSGNSKLVTFSATDISKKYDGSTKKVYVKLYDDYAGSIDSSVNLAQYSDDFFGEYMIYKNHAPEINADDVTITSKKDEFEDKNVSVRFRVNDDLDAINTLKYTLKDNKGVTKTGTIPSSSADDYASIEFEFGGDYDGEKRELTIEIMDSYGYKSEVKKSYNVHGDESPVIHLFAIESAEDPCTNDVCKDKNGLKTTVKLRVSDDLTPDLGKLNVCIGLEEGKCDTYKALDAYSGSSISEDGTYLLPYTIPVPKSNPLPYKGQDINVHVYIKDNFNGVTHGQENYKLYNNSKAMIDSSYPTVQSKDFEPGDTGNGLINKNPDLSAIRFSLKASDDFIDSSQLKYKVCYVTKPTEDITAADDVVCLNNNNPFDYSPDSNGVSTVNLDLGVTSYNGQKFYLFAKVYDNYALDDEKYVSYSSLAFYQVYQDIDAQVEKFTVSRPIGATSYENLNLVFKVNDPLDTYQVCVSENESSCTNYSSTVYDGDDSIEHTITYSPSWASTTDTEGQDFMLHLYVKDSHDKVTIASSFPDRTPCVSNVDENGTFLDSGMKISSVEYAINRDSQELTAAKCSNKCYYWDAYDITEGGTPTSVPASDTSGIKAFYTKTVTYVDKDDSSITCNKDVFDNFEVHCNFKSCYYNAASDNYRVTAIGYIKHANNGTIPHTHTTGDGSTHTPLYYRNEYTTDYDEKLDMIRLYPTGNWICGDCFDNGSYNNVIVTYDNNAEIGG